MSRSKELPQIGDTVLIFARNSTTGPECRQVRILATDCSTFTAKSLDGLWKGNNLRYEDWDFYRNYSCSGQGDTRPSPWKRISDSGIVHKTSIEDEIQRLNEKIAKLQVEIGHNQSIVAWMDESGTDTYDETQYKVWQTLTTIENESMSKIDKARAIAALLK